MVQKWIEKALELGFNQAVSLDVSKLKPRQDIRAMCAADQCRAYGKNWSCPPYCGSVEECATKISGYSEGILLQTVGQLEKTIDTKAYRLTEKRHLERFRSLAKLIRQEYPGALCLGSGGCRICEKCAWPEVCRFPEEVCTSMEGFGLFVTQVCRDHGVSYYYGERTIAYTACILIC